MVTGSTPFAVSTFYHFSTLESPAALKSPLLDDMQRLGLRGTITLAHEGINATIAGSSNAIEAMLERIRSVKGFESLEHRLSFHQSLPFGRGKVKVKRELISLGAKANPALCVGTHIPPETWNSIISAPDVITIDTRNAYEFAIGHFKGAINPATRNFKEMVAFTNTQLDTARHTRVAMYCTGGIRCEKYSSYLVAQGFKEVYHLKGGILAYLEAIPASQSLWEGECYVFDERVAVGHGLIPSTEATMCLGCGRPLYNDDRNHPLYIESVQCGACAHD